MQDLVVGASVRGKFDDDKQWYNGQVTERTNRSIPKFSYYSNTTTDFDDCDVQHNPAIENPKIFHWNIVHAF